MHYTFCPHCGSKLILKEIGDEGLTPFCENCSIPLWDAVTPCVICAVVNENREIALLRQDYVSATNYVCVAGVMKPGESAEETAIREIKEEIGQDVETLEYIQSYPYDKKEMLMLGFKATVSKKELTLSSEVDCAQWFSFVEAPGKLREGSIAWKLVNTVISSYK